jgi:hypothetical protein
MNMRKQLIIIIALSLSVFTYSQDKLFLSKNDVEKFSEEMSVLFSKNKASEAFNEMKFYWPLPETELDLIKEKSIKGLNIMEDRFGKSIDISKIKHTNLKDVFIKDVYFIRYKATVLRFVYTYYKNDEGWLLNSFKFDENFEEEF